ncbi:hypothetical protein NIES4106_18950 [Fischerella sp. NIES-4106]|nr:hypothetical protein NIES4106_18950 [Fischerella sp. NIES-4106]
MTSQEMEQRLITLEQEMAQIKVMLQLSASSPVQIQKKWWEKIVGSAADDPIFDEAERLGREWRKTAE